MLQKQKLLSAVFGAFSAIVSGSAIAALAGSEHDFNNGTDLCVNCHTPHNANTNMKPLWNHEASTQSYTMYDATFSTSLDMQVNDDGAGNPTGISAACLSCHDGTVAVDSYGGNTGTNFVNGIENLGIDLTNDHPINIEYNPGADVAEGFHPALDVNNSPLKLYNGQVECATCHDVHNTTTATSVTLKLLRMSNAGSAMCTTCHNK